MRLDVHQMCSVSKPTKAAPASRINFPRQRYAIDQTAEAEACECSGSDCMAMGVGA